MGFLKSIFGSAAAKTILLQGIAVPIVGTVVGFEVQKKLIKREQKKAYAAMQQQATANSEPIDAEVVDVETEFRP